MRPRVGRVISMNLYLASVYTSNFHKFAQCYSRLDEEHKKIRDNVNRILDSYHYVHKQRYVDNIRANGEKIFLDSGAYSAYTKGADVDLLGYCEYIHRNRDIIQTDDGVLCASVLDGIGNPELTYQNQVLMEKQGIRPLPCFHYGEDTRYLEYYVNNYEYITIGGLVPVSAKHLYTWLDRIWERHLLDGAGRPKVRVHGFGLTIIDLMSRYLWHSVDSSSWVQLSKSGAVFIPDVGFISVSANCPDKHKDNKHYETMSKAHQAHLLQLIEKQGFTYEQIANDYAHRFVFNTKAYKDLNRLINDKHNTPTQLVTEIMEIF